MAISLNHIEFFIAQPTHSLSNVCTETVFSRLSGIFKISSKFKIAERSLNDLHVCKGLYTISTTEVVTIQTTVPLSMSESILTSDCSSFGMFLKLTFRVFILTGNVESCRSNPCLAARGSHIIERAKIRTVKMTFFIVLGKKPLSQPYTETGICSDVS